jgi:ABC-type Mn2+/Zn2+ transport system ATPase subunit/ABC-type Zn uptake system ZnuABC Zn-binding protein ZnuA
MKSFLFCLVALLHCVTVFAQQPSNSLRIVGTTSFITDLVKNIAGDKHEVISLMPTGGDPHLYDPVPGDAQTIAEADLIFKNGLLLEGWVDKLITNSGTNGQIITVAEGVDAIRNEEYHGAPDPHAWMAIPNAIIYCSNIAQALIHADSANADYYRQNFRNYKAKLEALDQYIFTEIAKIPEEHRVLLTSHDAFRYYGNRYGLEVNSILGTSTDADVRIEDINNMIAVIRETGVPCIFIESTINPKLMEQIARDNTVVIGGKLFADSLGDEFSGASTFYDMLKQNTDRIVAGLTGQAAVASMRQDFLVFIIVILALFIASFFFVAYRLQKPQTTLPENSNHQVEISGLTVSYDRKTVLANLYLTLNPGKLYGLIGPNGAGKSTLFKAILGLLKPDAGSITIHGLPVEDLKKSIAYIPQRDEIDWQFPATVYDVVLMGRYPHLKTFQRTGRSERAEAETAMQLLGIAALRNRQIGELSGGQQQRVFLARALCQRADIYLFDEPFVGVDVTTEEKIIDILKELAANGKTILVIHHDLAKVNEYFTDVIMLNQRLIAAGETAATLTDENIRKTYTGQHTIMQEAEQYL